MKQREICSTDDFYRAVEETRSGHFWFRGEDSSNYALLSKFGRSQAKDSRNDLRKERALLTEFKRRSTPFIQHVPENDWEWLALAQHFGLITRLLDWTENPLIAAYFATNKIGRHDRVIYALDTQNFKYATLDLSPFELQEVALYRPKHISSRISSQSGVFTIHNSPSQVFDDDRLERWLIKIDCKNDINSAIRSYGINHAFIFPDLDGLSRYLNTMYIWGIVE